jgi:hypothetical protein
MPEPGRDETTAGQRTQSARAIVWTRRRRTIAAHWATFRRNRQGTLGIAILAAFGLIALFAPLLVDETQLEPATATAPRTTRPRSSTRSGPTTSGGRCLG